MSLTQKRSADEVEDGSSSAAAADRPSKKPRMIEENGVMRRETLKEKMRRERKEKKERKKLDKNERKKKKGWLLKTPKGDAAGSAEDAEAEAADAGEKQPTAEELAEAERKRQEKREKKDKKYNNKREKGDKKKGKSENKTEVTPAKESTKAVSPSSASATDVEAFLKKEQVLVTDPLESGLQPILAFSQLPATPFTAKKPFAAFSQPTPIQAASWPFSLAGRDVVGIAETGSGKTMAFAVPCIEALREAPKPAAVEAAALPNRSRLNNKWDAKGNVAQALAVIVSPTRELAMQTHAALAPLAASIGLTAVCLFGGASKDEQRVQLRQPGGVDIIVATPGRLKDFINDGAVSLAHARFAVLDEADRMLDTGFEDDIRFILGQCPDRTQRQTLMFTATWPTSVRGLADGFMTDPVKISIGGRGVHDDNGGEDGEGGGRAGGAHAQLQANARITQTVEVLDQRAKERRVLAIIKQEQRGTAKNDRILVFCLYKKEAVRVENFLQGQGVRVCSIHGDLRQEQRTRSLEAFKTGATPVLVATDVAARGLDIPEVKLVINVTFPLTIEDYVHRIGRTGRAGKEGRAITFFTELDKSHSGSLINVLRGAGQEVPEDLLKFGTTVKKKAHSTYGSFFKDVDMSQKGKKITFD